MLRAEIDITKSKFNELNLEKNNEPQIVFYITTGGTFSPKTKIKCISDKALCVRTLLFSEENVYAHSIGSKIKDDNFKESINEYAASKNMNDYGLNIKGFVVGSHIEDKQDIEEEKGTVIFYMTDIVVTPRRSLQ